MSELPTDQARHIGVSNFSPSQLDALLDATPDNTPYAHQMELHPYLPQVDYVAWHQKHNIHVTAYSPFGNTNPTYGLSRKEKAASAVPSLLETPLLAQIAKDHDCTPAQVALAFGIQRGTSVIPKSSHQDHIEENFGAEHCQISSADIEALETQLPVKRFNNPSKGWGVPLYDGLEDSSSAASGKSPKGVSETLASAKAAGDGWIDKVWRILRGWHSDM